MNVLIEHLRLSGLKFVNLEIIKKYCTLLKSQAIYPNKYGIAIPTHNELIAYNKTEEQVKTELGLNELIYLDLESLCDTLTELNPKIKDFEVSVFNGKYISNEQIM